MSIVQAQMVSPLRPRHSLMAALLALSVGLLAVCIPFVPHPEVFATSFVLLLCLVVPAWHRYQRREFDAFESIHVVGILHFTFFGLGAIWSVTDPYVTFADKYLLTYIPKAAFYSLLGYVGLMIGYFGPRLPPRDRRTGEDHPKGALFILIPGVLGFVGVLAGATWSRAFAMGVNISFIFSVLQQLSFLFSFAWVLGWLLVFSGTATANQRYTVWFGLLPAALLLVVSNLTTKYLVATIAGLPLLAYWYAKGRLPWRALIVLLLVVIFVIFPFYNNYRTFDASLPSIERVERTMNRMEDWDRQGYLRNSFGTFKKRLSLINEFAVVLRDVPRWVPHAKGRTIFLPFVYYSIPRAIWPEKPVFSFGQEFGATFRVVRGTDNKTSIAATVPGELYWNFDLPGVILGMALWGLVLRLLYRRYGGTPGLDPVRRATHVTLLTIFALFGGSLASNAVAVVRVLVLLAALCWLGRRFGLLERRATVP